MPGPADRASLRRRREALLLDLGALVYELQRRGQRAPDLLLEKAAELNAVDDELRGLGEEPADPASPCPRCGKPAEPGQLVCLECGSRLEPDPPSQPNSRLPLLALVLAAVVLGAGAIGFALSELTSDSDDDEAVASRSAKPAPSASGGEPQQTRTETAPAAPQPARRSPLLRWPAGLTAHTVVLVTTGDRPAARRVALAAARTGLESGLLRSDDFDLGSDLWIVFAGRFDNRGAAERQASNLAERYPGAYPQLLQAVG